MIEKSGCRDGVAKKKPEQTSTGTRTEHQHQREQPQQQQRAKTGRRSIFSVLFHPKSSGGSSSGGADGNKTDDPPEAKEAAIDTTGGAIETTGEPPAVASTQVKEEDDGNKLKYVDDNDSYELQLEDQVEHEKWRRQQEGVVVDDDDEDENDKHHQTSENERPVTTCSPAETDRGSFCGQTNDHSISGGNRKEGGVGGARRSPLVEQFIQFHLLDSSFMSDDDSAADSDAAFSSGGDSLARRRRATTTANQEELKAPPNNISTKVIGGKRGANKATTKNRTSLPAPPSAHNAAVSERDLRLVNWRLMAARSMWSASSASLPSSDSELDDLLDCQGPALVVTCSDDTSCSSVELIWTPRSPPTNRLTAPPATVGQQQQQKLSALDAASAPKSPPPPPPPDSTRKGATTITTISQQKQSSILQRLSIFELAKPSRAKGKSIGSKSGKSAAIGDAGKSGKSPAAEDWVANPLFSQVSIAGSSSPTTDDSPLADDTNGQPKHCDLHESSGHLPLQRTATAPARQSLRASAPTAQQSDACKGACTVADKDDIASLSNDTHSKDGNSSRSGSRSGAESTSGSSSSPAQQQEVASNLDNNKRFTRRRWSLRAKRPFTSDNIYFNRIMDLDRRIKSNVSSIKSQLSEKFNNTISGSFSTSNQSTESIQAVDPMAAAAAAAAEEEEEPAAKKAKLFSLIYLHQQQGPNGQPVITRQPMPIDCGLKALLLPAPGQRPSSGRVGEGEEAAAGEGGNENKSSLEESSHAALPQQHCSPAAAAGTSLPAQPPPRPPLPANRIRQSEQQKQPQHSSSVDPSASSSQLSLALEDSAKPAEPEIATVAEDNQLGGRSAADDLSDEQAPVQQQEAADDISTCDQAIQTTTADDDNRSTATTTSLSVSSCAANGETAAEFHSAAGEEAFSEQQAIITLSPTSSDLDPHEATKKVNEQPQRRRRRQRQQKRRQANAPLPESDNEDEFYHEEYAKYRSALDSTSSNRLMSSQLRSLNYWRRFRMRRLGVDSQLVRAQKCKSPEI